VLLLVVAVSAAALVAALEVLGIWSWFFGG
jgi:hypothetical protein